MASKSYTMTVYCSNCKQFLTASIPHGVPVRQFDIHSEPCSNCGVKSLSFPRR